MSRVEFGRPDKSQVIVRALEDGESKYVVNNTLTLGDRTIHVRSVFNRVDD